MWVLSLCIYWCDCWCCFLLKICCPYIDPWGPEESKPKIWMHINQCLRSAKVIPIQELPVQKLLCVDAAASDAENLCMWCLASLVDIFWEILFQNLWINSARLKHFTKQRFTGFPQSLKSPWILCFPWKVLENEFVLEKSLNLGDLPWNFNW